MQWLDVFGGADAWERDNPPIQRRDVVLTVLVGVAVAASLELIRSFADFHDAKPVWLEYLFLVLSVAPLLARRRFPVPVMLVGFATFFATMTWVPELGSQFAYQTILFFSIYSAAAWARDRHALALAVGAIGVVFLLWLAWDFAMGQTIQRFLDSAGEQTTPGLFPRVPAWIVYMAWMNVVYIVGAAAMGQVAWAQARDRDLLAESLTTITAQTQELQEQAVVDERLRIARELHDVVAHHVAVMGVQAAGARRVLESKPDLAAQALGNVEESAREAVAQMRGLLGALRATEVDEDAADRGPQPTLAMLPALLDEMGQRGIDVALTRMEPTPGALDGLPLPLQLSLYRVVQESLTNVERHSTARSASVALRLFDGDRPMVEAEILDDGRPRGGTSGTGLGTLGMRERVASHGGTAEIGPRMTGGYRVRVRFPVGQEAS